MKALLTGHSRGLGAAIASALLARRIPVLGLARAGNDVLATRYSDSLREVRVDLADSAALSAVLSDKSLQAFVANASTLLLINNAGSVQPVGPAATQDGAAVARAVALNVTAPLLLTGAVAALRGGRPLRVLHVSSGAARHAYPGWSIYGATKAALDQHARAVALDQSAGLRICSLAPGVVDTDMQTEIRALSAEQFPPRERFVGLKESGKLTSPAEAARQLLDYLLSEDFGAAPVADIRELSGSA